MVWTMLKIEQTEVYGWEAAIRGMRNPKNSWDKTDTISGEYYGKDENEEDILVKYSVPQIGENDHKLMTSLADAGQVHGKFLRMINVTMDVTAPLYWWKEFDTYKVGTVANSCSTMHKIQAKEFTREDFSIEHLIGLNDDCFPSEVLGGEYIPEESYVYDSCPAWIFDNMIGMLNACRDKFNKTKDKKYWWQMIQLLPSSYNQKRTVQLSYAVLKNIYEYRRNHKLDEWHTFCGWIEQLPYSELITGGTQA